MEIRSLGSSREAHAAINVPSGEAPQFAALAVRRRLRHRPPAADRSADPNARNWLVEVGRGTVTFRALRRGVIHRVVMLAAYVPSPPIFPPSFHEVSGVARVQLII